MELNTKYGEIKIYAEAWFVDPTVQNIKIIVPKNSIINTLY